MTDAQVDAAARELYNLEHPRGDDLWATASDDDREPYRYVARRMLEAAAAIE